ncbi:MAG: Rieske (2Fe-2S) protein [Rhodovarius sp.]|nr:Rieske (2Fe-2S) protein [Rhodovarius sp.]MDW8316102.1 Rieske (2Fe-2S) protein [Rhodovarius sp.]
MAPASAIPPGGRLVAEVAGRRIVIFNLGGEFFALADRCPHQGGPLSAGPVMGEIRSDCPGQYRYHRPGEILRCPWHAWEFDIRTGRSVCDPRRVKTGSYPARLASGAELALQAETFPVRVEESYVVVEI